jgi:hypothetical protein
MENPASLLRRLNPAVPVRWKGQPRSARPARMRKLPEHWLLKLLEQGKVTSPCWRGATNGIWTALAGSAGLAG